MAKVSASILACDLMQVGAQVRAAAQGAPICCMWT